MPTQARPEDWPPELQPLAIFWDRIDSVRLDNDNAAAGPGMERWMLTLMLTGQPRTFPEVASEIGVESPSSVVERARSMLTALRDT